MPDDRRQIAVFDDRPFFERALAFGVRAGILDGEKLAAIGDEGPKGMVQIAEYFGTQYLRPNIDEARERIVNLVSLFLEEQSGGDLEKAARSLRDGSFLSHSRGGSEMLKSLWAMPEDASFGIMVKQSQKTFLADWSLRSSADYRQARAERQDYQQTIDAALWFAERLGAPASEISTVASESIIRSAILVHLAGSTTSSLPNASEFVDLLARLRKNGVPGRGKKSLAALFKALPQAHHAVARKELQKVENDDLPRILDASRAMNTIIPELEPHYFLRDFGLEEASQFSAGVSQDWQKITAGKVDDNSLLTIFLCLAVDTPPRPALSKAAARTLIGKIRSKGLQRQPALAFIRAFAPYAMQDDLETLWKTVFPELEEALVDPADASGNQALAYLKENCSIR
ncbi:MAG: hypothetical protein AW11_02831 [Candidatus Accumulibacter regalis]|jgi:hypothetical protein|uniref:Uncharacterized protein n=1 Tax=Accumulibacter regalis TaxID=522306 RepID=A0A011NWG8_ACCRE|nr:hypothetical protein [Accumulibacter sp.]EXI87038.1 MAG: hypothetical protein AW11_02831 [Candidatus Accumulibacter regalis]HRE70500.1 hypothetical protein [Accumulibacter sp.]HRE85678.1 hypothetical protein [Accumulibacter sp.]HRI92563.1 hypothetical protein [Accumulibacter sp.]